jgi:DNA processing protein
MSHQETVYWLALQDKRWLIPTKVIERIYSETRSLASLWNADASQLFKLGLSDLAIKNFINYRGQVNFRKYQIKIDSILRNNFKLIKYVDKEYPIQLKDLPGGAHLGSPLVLIHKGSEMDFSKNVAIVGTRECSHYGHMMARRLARGIAKKGYTIVSGLARGVDTEAHCGALEVTQGKTIAVLAWMNPIYPPENAELAKDIERNGALISEDYSSVTKGAGKMGRAKFVDRNRITSGISRCIIAIESGGSGGTIHQVRLALSQGRKVFTLKPKPGNKRAKEGFKQILGMGATPIASTKPVLNFLESASSNLLRREKRLEEYS